MDRLSETVNLARCSEVQAVRGDLVAGLDRHSRLRYPRIAA